MCGCCIYRVSLDTLTVVVFQFCLYNAVFIGKHRNRFIWSNFFKCQLNELDQYFPLDNAIFSFIVVCH